LEVEGAQSCGVVCLVNKGRDRTRGYERPKESEDRFTVNRRTAYGVRVPRKPAGPAYIPNL
jgi:hypothetical protein